MTVLALAAGCAPASPAGRATAASTPDAGWAKAPAVDTQFVKTSTRAVVRRTRELMTTYVTLVVAAPESPALDEAVEAAFGEVQRLEGALSEWTPTTEISAVNAAAGGAPVAIGPELFEVLEASKRIGEATGGAFDVTFAGLGGLWDFRWQTAKIPAPAALAERLPLIDHRRLVLDGARRTAALTTKGMRVGLGGIAKGYIMDRVSAVLRARGFTDHLVSAGGDMVASGTKGGERWRIGIRDPHAERDEVIATVELSDEAISTAGHYERYFIKDGKRYHHILDPKTGMPAEGMASVTVVARRGLISDGFDTGLFVMGAREGLKVAARQGFDVLFIDDTGTATASPGMAARLHLEPRIEWLELARARARAAQRERPIVVALTAAWCEPCKVMEATTLRAPAVIAAGEGLLFARLDVDREPPPHPAPRLPALLLLDHRGDLLGRLEGTIEADDLATYLRAASAGYSRVARAPAGSAARRDYQEDLHDPREPR